MKCNFTPVSFEGSYLHQSVSAELSKQALNSSTAFWMKQKSNRQATNVEVVSTESSWKSRSKTLLMVASVVMICLSLTSFTFRLYTLNQPTTKVSDLQYALNHLKATMKIDSARRNQIEKIMAIIDHYNPSMPSEKKYAIANEIYEMTLKYTNLNVDLICATITHESALTWRPDITSQAGAMGLMQIMPQTGVLLAADEGILWTTPEKILYNPIDNIRLGCRYLSTLISLYELDGGLAAYNGGEKRAAMWLASGRDDRVLWEETRGYIPAVLKLYQQFQN